MRPLEILVGDARSRLADVPAGSVQCVVTSPPYFGLRDYGADGQIGLEASADLFIAELVAVFREVRRVLRVDGTLWLNIGDSYAGSWGARGRQVTPFEGSWGNSIREHPKESRGMRDGPVGTKAKDLMLIPERLLIALQQDGWWVRDRIVWAKPNPMPSSVRDRFCPAWEYVFLLSKARRYFFDYGAAREPRVGVEDANGFRGGSYVDGEPGPRQESGNRRLKVPGGWAEGPGAHGTIHPDGGTSAAYRDVGTGVGWGRLDRASPVVGDRGRDRVKRSSRDRSGNLTRSLYEAEVGDARGGAIARGFPWEDMDGLRLMRNVWEIATEPFGDQVCQACGRYYPAAEVFRLAKRADEGRKVPVCRCGRTDGWLAHFATFPVALADRCIRIGTSEVGGCVTCGAPWARVVEKGAPDPAWQRACGGDQDGRYGGSTRKPAAPGVQSASDLKRRILAGLGAKRTTGWAPSCRCADRTPVPQRVLDPFGGAGTTALAARRLQRVCTLVEVHPGYARLAEHRVAADAPLLEAAE